MHCKHSAKKSSMVTQVYAGIFLVTRWEVQTVARGIVVLICGENVVM